MKNLEYNRVDQALIKAIPELRSLYARDLGWWGHGEPPGQYLVFGFVLQPFLWGLLHPEGDSKLLRRVFAFLEEMARSQDIQVRNLLQVGLLEKLVGDRIRLEVASKYMGDATRALTHSTARTLRCLQNLPIDWAGKFPGQTE